MEINGYKSIFFDCDGVLLDSNGLKAHAFYAAAEPYGKNYAEDLLDYHRVNGGVSRVPKFEYFLTEILSGPGPKPTVGELVTAYEAHVARGLTGCQTAIGLTQLRELAADAMWAVVSGGLESEVRETLAYHGFAELFDGGVYGSPRDKIQIISQEFHGFDRPALFLGDSRYDYEVAREFGMDFIFVSGWTGMKGWKEFCLKESLVVVESLSALLGSLLSKNAAE